MMRILFLLIAVTFAAEPQAVNLSAGAFKPLATPIDKGTYAAVDLPVKDFQPALRIAEALNGGPLQSRGEAHLTVLTPPEIMRIDPKLRKKIIAEIKEAVAKPGAIKALCVGRGQAEVKGKMETTYYVVADAKAIAQIRERYHLTEFYPHVTLGFTKRDLHIEDGVRKDAHSCVNSVVMAP